MASSFSSDLKLELMVTGEKSGLWGDITNTNLNILQQAIAGFEAISIAGGAQTTALTFSNGLISNGKNAVIKFTGTITGNQVVTIPDGIEKTYIIENGTTGAFTVEFKTVSGTGVTFATTDKSKKTLFADGTNIVDVGNITETGVQTLTNKTLTSPKIGTSILDTNGNELALLTATGSAVNELTIANAATTAAPTISTTGSDTNISLRLDTKGTGGVVFNAGAVATPSITTTGDPNTGIFFPSADTIAFTEGGTEAMRINSSGAMLLGTTTTGSAGAGDLVVNGGVFLGGSAAANELDDYEEGTHTPTITPQTSGTITTGSGSTVMSYIKIGNRVFVNGYLLFATVSSPVGSFFTVTLPFTVKTGLSSDSEWGGGAIYFDDRPSAGAPAGTFSNKPFLFSAGSSTFAVYMDLATGLSTSDRISFTFSYQSA